MNRKYLSVIAVFFLLGISAFLFFNQYDNQYEEYDVCKNSLYPGWNTEIYDTEAGIFYEEVKQKIMEECNIPYPKINLELRSNSE
jgi:hypothetical protein